MYSYRPEYHYQPEKNWVNDPNGLIQFNGIYHLYFQYNPTGDVWGNIHWGHAVSKDLVNWETRPIAMKPDRENGEVHCFSGCAYLSKSGEPCFCYTSIGDEESGRGSKDGAEQWLAFPDGTMDTLRQTDKYAVRLTADEAATVKEWRDPCVLPYKDGYLLVLGCRMEEKDKSYGAALLYTSEDGLNFTYHSILAKDETCTDYFWECPNFFQLGEDENQYVLLYSPGREPCYIIGNLTEDLQFVPKSRGVVDMGGNEGYYAPQTLKDEKGRRIIIGWMPENTRGEWKGIQGWSGCQSLPREMYAENGVLKMRTVSEVDSLKNELHSGAIDGRILDAGNRFCIHAEGELAKDGTLTVDLLKNKDGTLSTDLVVDGCGTMTLQREHSTTYEGVHKANLQRQLADWNGKFALDVYVDHTTVEACCNGQWISARVYPSDENCTGAGVSISGGEGSCAIFEVKKPIIK